MSQYWLGLLSSTYSLKSWIIDSILRLFGFKGNKIKLHVPAINFKPYLALIPLNIFWYNLLAKPSLLNILQQTQYNNVNYSSLYIVLGFGVICKDLTVCKAIYERPNLRHDIALPKRLSALLGLSFNEISNHFNAFRNFSSLKNEHATL